jgi:transporter family-2 protein
MSATTIAIVLSLVAGVAGGVQASLSGTLGRRIGALEAAGFGALVAAALLTVATIAAGRGAGGLAAGIHQPPWLWLTGAMGAVVVATITYAPSRIGTFATIALLIAGQLAAGVVIDALGLLGSDRIPLTISRLGGLALLAAGAGLVLRR